MGPVVNSCRPPASDCNTLSNKLPSVHWPLDVQPFVTFALDASDRRSFEHLVAHGLRETSAVEWATRSFAARLRRFVIDGAALNSSSSTQSGALAAAFASCGHCGPHNTGYVGPFRAAIERVLASGSVRETWALVYILTKTHYFTALLEALLSPRSSPPGPPLITTTQLAARLGMDAAELHARWSLVRATRELPSTALRYSQGMPDFEFEPFESWVRFGFDASTRDGQRLWSAARVPWPAGCRGLMMLTNDARIEPPLSDDEVAYQCAGAPPPCRLRWSPGASCFDLPNVSWSVSDGQVRRSPLIDTD